ncbi:MAG: Spo0E family sporulation regulatory protein-aspartic acid phosphatase [Caulobacteraceae bacterium]
MAELNDLLKDIETLRENLIKLIEKNEYNLQAPDVIAASQILNAAIIRYNEFIKNKI